MSFELLPYMRNLYRTETIDMKWKDKQNIFISKTTELCFILPIQIISD